MKSSQRPFTTQLSNEVLKWLARTTDQMYECNLSSSSQTGELHLMPPEIGISHCHQCQVWWQDLYVLRLRLATSTSFASNKHRE